MERWFAKAFRDDVTRLSPWQNMYLRTPVEGYIGCARAIMGADFRDRASSLSLPITTMVGAEDGATPPELVEATAKLYDCTFNVIDGAAHLPCVEMPEATARLIVDFVENAYG